VNLQQLKSFVRIAELGSLSRASDRMRIAQPALSRQMKLLQQEMGVELFERHHRGMRLTEAGEELLRRVPGLMRQLDQAYADVRSFGGAVRGQVVLGVVPTVSYILAGKLAHRVATELPDVALRIVESYSGHLVEWLQRREVDVAIIYGPASSLHMMVEELLVEELVLIGPPNSNLRVDTPVSVAAFAKLPLVLPSRPHGLRMALESAAARADVKLSVRFEADSFRVLEDLVVRGLGYTALPLSAVSREVEQGKLSYAPLTQPKVTRQLVLGVPDSTTSRATRMVIALIYEETALLVHKGAWRARLQFTPNRTFRLPNARASSR
jgi:LysR family transcriptional regulator, nitrogen assimilation regulatory protein